jgi:hypothetical protein
MGIERVQVDDRFQRCRTLRLVVFGLWAAPAAKTW